MLLLELNTLWVPQARVERGFSLVIGQESLCLKWPENGGDRLSGCQSWSRIVSVISFESYFTYAKTEPQIN